MGYLYRPRLKDITPPPEPKAGRCPDSRHGREDACPGCGARFGKTWWVKYYVNGTVIRESTETEKETEARRFLKNREGSAVKGQPILPRVDRIRYEEAAADLRTYYRTTGAREMCEAEKRLRHLDAFFRLRRLAAIGPADVAEYTAVRQTEYAKPPCKAHGAGTRCKRCSGRIGPSTINRELGVLGKLLKLAYENGKLLRLPILRKLKEPAPRSGFFERGQFEAVKRHLRPDLQVAVSIEYAFGWRCQSEVLTLERTQVNLGACTIRLAPGTTKNDDGRLVYLTPELVELLQAQEERVQILEMRTGRPVPFLFPWLDGRRAGRRIPNFRAAWERACLEATLDVEGLEGPSRAQRKTELLQAVAKGERPGLLKMLRHDFRRTAVRNMVNRCVPERVAMKITGHKTRAVFDRYHIVSPADLQEAARKLTGTFSGTLPDGAPESSTEVVEKPGGGW